MPLKTSPRIQRLLLACCLLFFAVAVVLTVAPVAAQIIIIDDGEDVPGTEISADNINVGESEGKVYVKVKLSESAPDTVTVQYQTIDDTAVAPGDYTATNGSLVFAVGETEKTIEITIIDDSVQETNETFTVQLSNPTNGELDPNADQSTVTIIDDDGTPPTVEFTTASHSVSENAGTVSVEVSLSDEFGKTVTVDFANKDGSAVAPGDYTAAAGTLTFSPGETAKSLQVAIVDDGDIEAQESFSIDLSNPGNATLGGLTGATVNVMDDEMIAPPGVQFLESEYQVNENEGTVTIELTIDSNSQSPVKVKWKSAGIQPWPATSDDFGPFSATSHSRLVKRHNTS